MKPPDVVLLDAPSSLGIQVVHSLHKGGFRRLTTVSAEPWSRLRFSRCCRHVVLPGWDWSSGVEALAARVRIPDGAVVLPMTTSAVRWCLRHRAVMQARWRLTLLPDGAMLERVIDKVQLGEMALDAGVRAPRTFRLRPAGVEGLEGLEGFVRAVGFPLLLKPVRGSGGIGIVEARDRGELRRHWSSLAPGVDYCLQEFVPGEDVSCGVVAEEGRVRALVAYEPLTRRDRFGAFRSLRAKEDPGVEREVSRLMAAWGWSGPACLDFRRTGQGELCLLDFNPRPWGNMRSLLGTGVNFPAMLCLMAVGATPRLERVLPVDYLSPGDALRQFLAGRRTAGDAGRAGPRGSGWSFVFRDPGLYVALAFLAAWDRGLRQVLRFRVSGSPAAGGRSMSNA